MPSTHAMFFARTAHSLAAATLLALAGPAMGQSTLILDDFDGDDSDELFERQGLIAIVQSDGLPTLIANDNLVTPGDIGGVTYIDNEADINLVVGQWPNDAGAGTELGLDFEQLRIIGFEADFRDVSQPFPFGFTIFDSGPSGTPERKIASVDATISAGDSTLVTLFSDDDWAIENGFEFDEIGSVYYGLNANPRPGNDAIDPVEQVVVRFVEFRAIVTCLADVNRDGVATPADFTAWVVAFNDQSSTCDQNGDGECNPADFTAWVLNFNSGC
ncbi:MAG: GC-type dockerin domain-anchored protein [Planctomycetota bacterium]